MNVNKGIRTCILIIVLTSGALVGEGQLPTRSATTAVSDTAFVGKNIRDHIMEIQMSQLALQKGSSRLHTIARQLVKDHSQMLTELQTLTRTANMPGNYDYGFEVANSNSFDSAGSRTMQGVITGSGKRVASNELTPSAGVSGNPGITSTQGGITGSGRRTNGTGNGATLRSMGTARNGSINSGTTGAGRRTGQGITGTASGGLTNGGNTTIPAGELAAADTSGRRTIPGNTAMVAAANNGSMQHLQSSTGSEFDKAWLADMLAAHEAKLAELNAALTTVINPDLKTVVTRAIPVIRLHRDLLTAIATPNNSNPNGKQ